MRKVSACGAVEPGELGRRSEVEVEVKSGILAARDMLLAITTSVASPRHVKQGIILKVLVSILEPQRRRGRGRHGSSTGSSRTSAAVLAGIRH